MRCDVRCIIFICCCEKFCITPTEKREIYIALCLQIQRLYGRYLRAESFRKALIYQKKYLLFLIGGFRDTEEDTLAMIARMGAEPSPNHLTHRHLSPLSKFRSAARVVVAISRFFIVLSVSSIFVDFRINCVLLMWATMG